MENCHRVFHAFAQASAVSRLCPAELSSLSSASPRSPSTDPRMPQKALKAGKKIDKKAPAANRHGKNSNTRKGAGPRRDDLVRTRASLSSSWDGKGKGRFQRDAAHLFSAAAAVGKREKPPKNLEELKKYAESKARGARGLGATGSACGPCMPPCAS
jgi:hypothetical protein